MPAPDFQFLAGDCLDALKSVPDNSQHALVTDPPGGPVLTDMDREGLGNYHTYSGQLAKGLPRIGAHKGNLKEHPRARAAFVAFLTERLTEAHRTLRPGGFGLAMDGDF